MNGCSCGNPDPLPHHHLTRPDPVTEVRYCLMVPGDAHPVQTYARDPEGFGAIQAVNHAQALSLNGTGACSVYIGDRFLVAYEAGRRVANGQ